LSFPINILWELFTFMCMLHVTPITPLTFLTRKISGEKKNVNFKGTHLHVFLRLILMFPEKFFVRIVMWEFRVKNHETFLRSEIRALYDMTSCQFVNSYERFGEIRCLIIKVKCWQWSLVFGKVWHPPSPRKVCNYLSVDAASCLIRLEYLSTQVRETLSLCLLSLL
jgi:hypothetical protein